MTKSKIAKLLLALGIGVATVFSGAAFAGCDDNTDNGKIPGDDTTNTTPDDSGKTPDEGGTKNPVISIIPTTDEGFEQLLASDKLALKANTPVTVDVPEDVEGEYLLFIVPPECLEEGVVSTMPYPDLVITATISANDYEFSWNTFWGTEDMELIDFTSVTSFTVTANEDVSVVMALLDYDDDEDDVTGDYDYNGKDDSSVFAFMGTPIVGINITGKDTADVYLKGVDEPLKAEAVGTSDLGGKTIIFLDFDLPDDYINLLLIVDDANSRFYNFNLDFMGIFGLEETGRYTGEINGKAATISLYYEDDGGFIFFTVDGKSYDGVYREYDGDIIRIAGIGYFQLDTQNNTFAPCEEE